jgi:NAD(P)H-flavin reductase
MLPAPARVLRAARETADVVTLTFEGAAGGSRFAAGQFNMVYAFGIGEVPLSISGDPARPEVVVHTVRAIGAVTEAICRVRRNGILGLRGPYGRPWPLADAKGQDVLLVAGGLGLAPLRPAILHLLAHHGDYGRVSLLVGARTPEDLLFRRDLARWRKRRDLELLITVDRAPPDWKEDAGVVTALLPRAGLRPERAVAFVCGPEVMMRFTVRELGRLGLEDRRIHLSLERNMKCAVGFCGHCQFGPSFICKDGPVLSYERIRDLFWLREV